MDDICNPYDWFALVCNPPHECLFAKSSGYDFWPSRVIEIFDLGQTYYVRYFNAKQFQRDFIPIDKLKSNDESEYGTDYGTDAEKDEDFENTFEIIENFLDLLKTKKLTKSLFVSLNKAKDNLQTNKRIE